MNNNSSKQVLLSVIGVAILVVAVVGVSFAFFSYVYNGDTANEINTGTIVFTASDDTFALTNVFPTTSASTEDGEIATVSIQGNTTYEKGIDFVVKAVNVVNKNPAITPTVSVTTTPIDGVVSFSETYSGNTLTADAVLARGTIAAGTGVTSETTVVTVSAFYDSAKYHISENNIDELDAAGLLDKDTFKGTIIEPSVWNALAGAGESAAFSFKIQVTATQAESGRLQ